MDDNKKRMANIQSDDGNMKRYRESDQVGNITSKLLVPKQEFAKVIGKGGHMVTNIRSSCGVELKGLDVEEDKRMIVITGKFNNVVDAFDAVADILFNSFSSKMQASTQLPPQNELFGVTFMIDNDMAGKVMGAKGSVISTLRANSGVMSAKMTKDIQTINAQSLRALTVEGSLMSIRRMNFLLLRVLTDGVMTAPDMYSQSRQVGGVPGVPMQPQSLLTQSLPVLPLESLPVRGVHADAVRQLAELRNYLSVYSLDLMVVDSIRLQPQMLSIPNTQPHSLQRYPTNLGPPAHMHVPVSVVNNTHTRPSPTSRQHQSHDANQKVVEFGIPVEKVGVVIGKGACALKSLQAEFGLYIVVDKEERHGMRTVIIKGDDDNAIHRAKEKIMLKLSESSAAAISDTPAVVVEGNNE